MVRENTPGIQGSQTALIPGRLRWHGGDGELNQTIGIDISNRLGFGSHNGLPSVSLHLRTPELTVQLRSRDASVNDRITTVRSPCRRSGVIPSKLRAAARRAQGLRHLR